MSKLWRIAYNGIVIPAAGLALPLARRARPDIERAAAGREGLFERWEAALEPLLDRSPRIWLHAASAGETLQARPLAEEIRRARPGAALLYTHFSPSASRWASDLPAVDVADYLPFDSAGRMRRFLELTAPDLLLLVGGETWPNLIWSATDRGVPVAQVCARLVGADRMGWPVRGLTRDLYRRLDAVAAVGEEDGALLERLGVAANRIRVAGDTRADVTLERARRVREEGPQVVLPEGRSPVIVAGSTWPSDEAVLLPALAGLASIRPGLLALVAPHEPTEEAVRGLEARARGVGLGTTRWSSPGGEAGPVVIVDRVGVLYRLYAPADLAYVGGGFGGAVHNTMEPAAMGVSVAIGPRHGGPYEVGVLARAGGLEVVGTSAELRASWVSLLEGDRARRAGEAAREALHGMAGAPQRILRFLAERGHPVA
ncbi:MAG: 3-deoxy-D-manno-octulosonic acid transferase [Gemmatimonadota bacterium]